MNMGRKKIQMKMIERADARQVAFTKRRSGVFKKASELCMLCAVETALVVFSPGGKAFSFGYPSVEAVMDRLNHTGNSDSGAIQKQGDHDATLHELYRQYFDALEQLEIENERAKELKRMTKVLCGKCLLDAPIEDFNLDELEILDKFLEKYIGNLRKQTGKLSTRTFYPATSSSANPAGIHCSNPTPVGCRSLVDNRAYDVGYGD